MPHQCVKCGKLFEEASQELLKGCETCGGKFFFFMKKKDIQQVQQATAKLTDQDKQQLEKDALELIGEEGSGDDEEGPEQPVVLDLESIRMLQPGKFEIDLVDIFKGRPLVYKLEDGKYIIDIAQSFKEHKH
ncbi:MAG TPA: Zn-ribbon containing protein [Candidatus Nanoarchaeia archaeon]|nr:Zn-ribbon containing protein [Candidatus Nanoarchaeia archaeon]